MSQGKKKELHYEVEAILDEKKVNKVNKKSKLSNLSNLKETLYLVHWKKFSKEEGCDLISSKSSLHFINLPRTWEPEKNLTGAEEILKKWKTKQGKTENLKDPVSIPKRSLRSNTKIPDFPAETKPTKSKAVPRNLKQPDKAATTNKPTSNKSTIQNNSLKRQHPNEKEDIPEVKKLKLNPLVESNAPKTRSLRNKVFLS